MEKHEKKNFSNITHNYIGGNDARWLNGEADEAELAAAEDFLAFILSDEAKAVFDSYYFDTDVE